MKTPVKLGSRGRAFWRDVTAEFELNRDEHELLAEACRSLDQLDDLRAAVDAEGVTVLGSEGQTRVHPAVSQINATRTLLGRLLAQLALPDPEGETMLSPTQQRAQKAARDRWAEHNANKSNVTKMRGHGSA